jgi:hypothetical protein
METEKAHELYFEQRPARNVNNTPLAVPEVETLRNTNERSGSELLVLGDSCAGLEIYNYLI